jgi:hypothetical protein
MTFHTTLGQDLNPRSCEGNDHPSVLSHEMMTIDPGGKPTRMLTWKSTTFIHHIQSRSHNDRFPLPLWETWFWQSLGVPIPVLLENPRQCPCRQFHFDPSDDDIQTCQCQPTTLPPHEWIVYRLSLLLSSVGHRVQTHRITPAAGNERGDNEIKDYVILLCGEDDKLPPHTLVMEVNDSWPTTQRTNGTLSQSSILSGELPTWSVVSVSYSIPLPSCVFTFELYRLLYSS